MALIDHSSCIEHHFKLVYSLFYSFLLLDARLQLQEKCMGSQRYVLIRNIARVCFHLEYSFQNHSPCIFFLFSLLFINIFIFFTP